MTIVTISGDYFCTLPPQLIGGY